MKKITILISTFIALLTLFYLVTSEIYSIKILKDKNRLNSILLNLKIADSKLNFEVLKSSINLYQNYDNLVTLEKKIENYLKELKNITKDFNDKIIKEEVIRISYYFNQKFR